MILDDTRTADVNRYRSSAREMAPALRDRRLATVRDRRVPDATIAELHERNLLRLLQPVRFGGEGASYDSFMAVTEELAMECPSTGWVYAVLGEHAWVLAGYPEQAQIDVWGADPRATVSSSFAPRATATVVDGGVRITGKWSFSSGCDHATWVMVGAFVPNGDGSPSTVYLLIPKSELTVIDDWHVLGLSGTGSKSLVIEDRFVPSHRILSEADAMTGRVPGAEVHPDYALVHAPRGAFAVLSLAPVMLGLAQTALDKVVAMVATRVSRGVKVAELESTQLAIAEASAMIDLARQFIGATCQDGLQRLEQGSFTTLGLLAGRRNAAYATRMLRQAVITLCDHVGGAWVYDTEPLQDVLRDVLTASSHRLSHWDSAGAAYGKALLEAAVTA